MTVGKRPIISYTLLIVIAIAGIVPFTWVIYGSFMPRSDIDAGRLWPSDGTDGFTLANYRLTFDKLQGFDLYYRNSLLLAVGGTFLVLLAGSLAAFALARYRFLGNRLIFLIFLLTIMVPAEVTLMGQFDLLLATGLYSTLTGLCLSYVAGNLVLTIFLMRNVFAGIPNDVIDAAAIDGASRWQVFWQVCMPIGANGLSACAILTFLNIWNEFTFALTMTVTDKAMTLPVGITLLQGQWSVTHSGALFATVMMSFVPMALVFVLLQKYFVRGLTAGAVKG
ncbi:MAG TPA: carbohydrate ABC transporter permease [Phycisphaerae bacterium]|nr:carbohydrate ABC transporter permease [Phycisphaerae bacterium]